MRQYALLVVILFAAFGLQGCNTLRGAKEGFKKDWQEAGTEANKMDGWVKENLW